MKRVSFVPKKTLKNFKQSKEYFKQLILATKTAEFKETYHAPLPVANAFRELFPDIVEQRGVLESTTVNHCNQLIDFNDVIFREGPLPKKAIGDESVEFLGVGGPTAVAAAALAKAGGIKSATHTWYTRRGSNFDGSAYYYHIRDAFPVYINSVNRGPYCVYTDLAKRACTGAQLEEWARTDTDYVKIHMSWANLLRQPHLIWEVFIPNFIKMMLNIYIKPPKDTDISQVVKLSATAKTIAAALQKALEVERPLLLHGPDHLAFYAGVTNNKDVVEHFNWLAEFAPGEIHFKADVPENHGLGVEQLLHFPGDGCMSPHIFEDLRAKLDAKQSDKVIEVVVDSAKGVCATFERQDKSRYRIFADNAVVSLGPYCRMLDARGKQIGKTTMWAAGSSSVVLVTTPLSVETDFKSSHIQRFKYFLDSVNQHWTPIESKAFIDANGQEHLAFALQMTGGGNFPSRYTCPDTVYNLMFNFERIFLERNQKQEVYYDLIQTRSCPRVVTYDNTIAFERVGTRLALAYGQGGIGMTTMLPNGELALRLTEAKRPLDIYNGVNVLKGIDIASMCANY